MMKSSSRKQAWIKGWGKIERRRSKTKKRKRRESGVVRESRTEVKIRCVSSWRDHTQPSSITDTTGGKPCCLMDYS